MTSKTCQSCKSQFVVEDEDLQFYKKMEVSPPTWCPECRMVRRFVFRNEHKFYKRKDSLTGEYIFSGFHQDAKVKVCKKEFWWSDGWDPLEYGRDYDFSRSFFEQFRELMLSVPLPSLSVANTSQSDYCNNGVDLKNCYLCFDLSETENSAYVIGATCVKEGFDLYQSHHSELCYDCYMADECHRVFFSTNIEESSNIWFSKNILGSSNCFGCVNLRNKNNYIFNKPVSAEEFNLFIKNFKSGSFRAISEMREKAAKIWSVNPNRFTLAINVENATGEHIEHSKNLYQCYFVHDSENLRYCQFLTKARDSQDYSSWGSNANRVYESVIAGKNIDNVSFSATIYRESKNIGYSFFCFSSSDLFGCAGLSKKQYCILNKQYSKEEYFKLREKIIQHMDEAPYADSQGREYKYGEFFPPEFSPFAYNETIAQDFFPLTKEEAIKKGYTWREVEEKEFKITKKAGELPDDIKDAKDDITKEVIGCEQCQKPYRVIPTELQFYRRIPLPLPRLCVECRFNRRFKWVNPPKFWPRRCQCAGSKDESGVYANGAEHFHKSDHCPNEFESSFDPSRTDIVYCEACYRAEVV